MLTIFPANLILPSRGDIALATPQEAWALFFLQKGLKPIRRYDDDRLESDESSACRENHCLIRG